MSIASFIVIALAVAVCNMVLFRRSAEAAPIRLSAGLLAALLTVLIHTAFYAVGILLGNLLRFTGPEGTVQYNDVNSYILLGLFIAVAIKVVYPYLRRNPQLPAFRMATVVEVLAMAAASGINVFLLGLGVGFVCPRFPSVHAILWPMLICCFPMNYLGIMFGRQNVPMRPRRWMVVAAVLILGVGIATVVNNA